MIAINKQAQDNKIFEMISTNPITQDYPSIVPQLELAFVQTYLSNVWSAQNQISLPAMEEIKSVYLYVRVYYEPGTGRIKAVQPDVVMESINGVPYGVVIDEMYTGSPSNEDLFYDFRIEAKLEHKDGFDETWGCITPFIDDASGTPLRAAIARSGAYAVANFFKLAVSDFDQLSDYDFADTPWNKIPKPVYEDLANWGENGPSSMNGPGNDYVCL